MTYVSPLHRWARELVGRQPAPPRQVDLWPLLRLELRSEQSRYLLILGLLGIAGVLLFALAPGGAVFRTVGQLVAGGLVIWSVVRPVWRATRLRSTFRSARRGKAIVVDASYLPPRDAGGSVDALRNGMTIGHWRIADEHDDGPVLAFRSDAPWAASLTRGAEVEVLLDELEPVWELGVRNR